MNKTKIITSILGVGLLIMVAGCKSSATSEFSIPKSVVLSKEVIQDKIKGGWAGQMIGVTFGGPTEFRYNSRIIPDSTLIPWPDSGYCKWWFDNRPGLYDDIYMDLTFVEVFEKDGIDAPVENFALAFANAEYPLWHANQAARYNIMNGIMPPESGFWKNNPHSDDIDFQIESDFAGLMSPGMPVAASQISDKIGHIMNYGDGWYGGVYVSAMYSLAFLTDNIDFIVREALKMVPEESDFYEFMTDVIKWSEEYSDWKQTWLAIEEKWGNDVTCPDGLNNPFNIEAKMNCAYILMGLLYGDGDIGKTIEISTRCGADSDCNPSNAAGILCTALGYNKIPDKWLRNVKEVEDIKFPFTNLTLNETYAASYNQALLVIGNNAGKIKSKKVMIAYMAPSPVRYEKSFEGVVPIAKETLNKPLADKPFKYSFEGTGILISARIGNPYGPDGRKPKDYVANVEVFIDGNLMETVKFPANFRTRKLELYWNFDLVPGSHVMELKLQNPSKEDELMLNYTIAYTTEGQN